MKTWSRREFISTTAASLSVAAGTPLVATLEMRTSAAAPKRVRRPKVSILATEVRKHSHAQHFIDRFLEGYGWHGRHHRPPMDLASIYVDQFPENDLARDRSQRHNVKIYPTIAEALTLGGSKLAVDGVLIIAEHGKYPRNEKGQTLYPRYKFFQEVVRVFESSGRSVPVFNDKHLSTDWTECVAMMDAAKRLRFPFLAGSSLPVTWRIPAVEIPIGTPLSESVCICYGGVDSYDIHGLETAQCMSERRKGGEVGVKSVHAMKGNAVWSLLESREPTRKLFFAALARSFTLRAPQGYTFGDPKLDWLSKEGSPIAYVCEHLDGFRTTLFLMNGLVSDFTYAGLRSDNGQVYSCQMFLPMPTVISTTADFFNPLVNNIERMILENAAPYPAERTLLTSGMTLFGVESLHRGEVLVPTPELAIKYKAPAGSTFWRA